MLFLSMNVSVSFSDRLTAQQLLCRGCPNMCLYLWSRGCGFSTTELQRTKGRCAAVAECNISRKVEWTSRTNCMVSSVAGPNSDVFFPMRTPEGSRLCTPSQDYRGYRCNTSSNCDKSRCRQVTACSRECYAMQCRLPWNWRTPLLTLLQQRGTLKTKRHRTYALQCFRLLFNKE
jgi:hypothetical protein